MLTDRSFRITGSGCGEETNVATVDTDSDRLTVTVVGTITGRDGSMTGELDRVAYDSETRELRVTVETTDRNGDMFPQCLTEIEYEATFQFAEELPSRVVVEHHSLDRTRPVVRFVP